MGMYEMTPGAGSQALTITDYFSRIGFEVIANTSTVAGPMLFAVVAEILQLNAAPDQGNRIFEVINLVARN